MMIIVMMIMLMMIMMAMMLKMMMMMMMTYDVVHVVTRFSLTARLPASPKGHCPRL